MFEFIFGQSHFCIIFDWICVGPLNWGTLNALCDGTSQSPINIVTSAATMSSTLKPLELGQHWNASGLPSATYTLKNKGYSVQLDVKTNDGNKHIETTQGGNIRFRSINNHCCRNWLSET